MNTDDADSGQGFVIGRSLDLSHIPDEVSGVLGRSWRPSSRLQ
jgi:hypothetical protein